MINGEIPRIDTVERQYAPPLRVSHAGKLVEYDANHEPVQVFDRETLTNGERTRQTVRYWACVIILVMSAYFAFYAWDTFTQWNAATQNKLNYQKGLEDGKKAAETK